MADCGTGWCRSVAVAFGLLLSLIGLVPPTAKGTDLAAVLAEAEDFVHQNSLYLALERLREAARLAPGDYRIPKLRGDVLMSFRRNEEAVAAYREAAALAPDALDVHWALWTLLDRMGGAPPGHRQLEGHRSAGSRQPAGASPPGQGAHPGGSPGGGGVQLSTSCGTGSGQSRHPASVRPGLVRCARCHGVAAAGGSGAGPRGAWKSRVGVGPGSPFSFARRNLRQGPPVQSLANTSATALVHGAESEGSGFWPGAKPGG
ncbi:MAG: hypothetical protein KatS3mg082_0781 [Nitrospiraceae bacterium]|nr:MAG: hypothetical protein KatS3mg082_0781 [Nitrospiraceae bacterium]